MLGELSSALEGEELAPGTEETLRLLRDPVRRPPRPREVLPAHLREIRHGSFFKLDEDSFTSQARCRARSFWNDLRPSSSHLGQSQGHACVVSGGRNHGESQIPANIIGAVRVGRMTAFRKRTGESGASWQETLFDG